MFGRREHDIERKAKRAKPQTKNPLTDRNFKNTRIGVAFLPVDQTGAGYHVAAKRASNFWQVRSKPHASIAGPRRAAEGPELAL
jgi:hypothetical protein